VVRAAFDRGSRATTTALLPFAPAPGAVTVQAGLRYRPDDPDALFDVYAPAGRGDGPLPTIVWVHGGGWLSGARAGFATWAQILADRGFTVVVPGYTLAPAAPYPQQLQQVLDALTHLRTSPPPGVDPTRLFLAGDSAGASLVAQVATVVTHPAYGETVGVSCVLPPDAVAGLLLCCGPYDLGLISGARGLLGWASTTIGWAYLGTRAFAADPRSATLSLVDHVYPGFPPTYLTGGNGDPLTRGALVYAERLAAAGTHVETLFFDEDYTERGSPLGHEYQFDLRLTAARSALDEMVSFVTRRSAEPAPGDRSSPHVP
jgi:acetyl esterase